MKLHDLQPARGAHTAKTRVGRGIAAGKGKTAGRGTKGQKARAGGTIPPWFEGGQTPIHVRIPKLRGFRNRGKIEFEVVNLGRIARLVELGELESGELPGAKAPKSGKAAPITVNQEILRAAGLVSTLNKPLKILGQGDVATALFVVADAFSKSAVTKIEAAGGSVQVLEIPGAAPTDASETPKLTKRAARKVAGAAAAAAITKDVAERKAAPRAEPAPKVKAAPAAKAPQREKGPKGGSRPDQQRGPKATGDAPSAAETPEATASPKASAPAERSAAEAPAPTATSAPAEPSAPTETPAPTEAPAPAEASATADASSPTESSVETDTPAPTEGSADSSDESARGSRRKASDADAGGAA
jgi:large subunit ribosomal protein L15